MIETWELEVSQIIFWSEKPIVCYKSTQPNVVCTGSWDTLNISLYVEATGFSALLGMEKPFRYFLVGFDAGFVLGLLACRHVAICQTTIETGSLAVDK